MTDEQKKFIIDALKTHVAPEIAEGIKVNVNGKIDKLTKKVEEAIDVSKAAAETAYVASRNNNVAISEFKEDIRAINDLLQPFKDIKATARVLKWIIITLTLVTGAVISIKTVLK